MEKQLNDLKSPMGLVISVNYFGDGEVSIEGIAFDPGYALGLARLNDEECESLVSPRMLHELTNLYKGVVNKLTIIVISDIAIEMVEKLTSLNPSVTSIHECGSSIKGLYEVCLKRDSLRQALADSQGFDMERNVRITLGSLLAQRSLFPNQKEVGNG